MRIRVLTIGLFLTALLPLSAQLLVEVTLEQEQFLPGEALSATVRVSNRSGRTLKLGTDEDWLTFAVQGQRASLVDTIGEAPVLGEFTLATGEVASKKVDLAAYFALTRPGSYHVIATVRIKDWASLANSAPKRFDIIEGTKLWAQDFGVPSTGYPGQPPEVRRYALLQANYLHSALRLYFRLTEAAGTKVLKVFSLGEIVSFGRPETEVDGQSRLHVLHQNGARTSRYTVINPDGDIVLRQVYEYAEARPRLVLDREGKLVVAGSGAVRRPDKDDVPAPKAKD